LRSFVDSLVEMRQAGSPLGPLGVVQRCPFMHAEAEITPREWNLTYVARKAASRDDKVVARRRVKGRG